MGGEHSDMFAYFKILILQGLVAARKHHGMIIDLVEIMRSSKYFSRFRSVKVKKYLRKIDTNFTFVPDCFFKFYPKLQLLD